jgi:hypothetical protein
MKNGIFVDEMFRNDIANDIVFKMVSHLVDADVR